MNFNCCHSELKLYSETKGIKRYQCQKCEHYMDFIYTWQPPDVQIEMSLPCLKCGRINLKKGTLKNGVTKFDDKCFWCDKTKKKDTCLHEKTTSYTLDTDPVRHVTKCLNCELIF